MKKLLVVNYVLIAFLACIFVMGVYVTYTYYVKYGVSWVETTIIHGEVEIKTVTIYENAVSTGIFLLLTMMFALNASEMRFGEQVKEVEE